MVKKMVLLTFNLLIRVPLQKSIINVFKIINAAFPFPLAGFNKFVTGCFQGIPGLAGK